MINFIILEDNKIHLEKTKKIINKYMMKNDYEYDISTFCDITTSFKELIGTDSNKIYILDFELPRTNAIEVARLIRKEDWVSPIIVFSVNGGMAYDTFKQRLQILDFVNKQFEPERNLHELFDICFKQFNFKNALKYKIGHISYSLDYDKIYYIYRDTSLRKTVIVTNNQEYKISMPLVKVKELLTSDFVYTHKSCIVNLRRVNAFDWSNLVIMFDNGKSSYLLSRTHRKELKKNVVC